MKTLTIADAKKNLSKWLQAAAQGEEVAIVSGADQNNFCHAVPRLDSGRCCCADADRPVWSTIAGVAAVRDGRRDADQRGQPLGDQHVSGGEQLLGRCAGDGTTPASNRGNADKDRVEERGAAHSVVPEEVRSQLAHLDEILPGLFRQSERFAVGVRRERGRQHGGCRPCASGLNQSAVQSHAACPDNPFAHARFRKQLG